MFLSFEYYIAASGSSWFSVVRITQLLSRLLPGKVMDGKSIPTLDFGISLNKL